MLVSSHLLAEVQQLVDQVVILHRGRLVRQGTLAELADLADLGVGPDPTRRPAPGRTRPHRPGPSADPAHPDPTSCGSPAWPPPRSAAWRSPSEVELHQLSTEHSDLEQAFLDPHRPSRPAAGRPSSRRRADMRRLVAAEFHKLATTRLWLWLLVWLGGPDRPVRQPGHRLRRHPRQPHPAPGQPGRAAHRVLGRPRRRHPAGRAGRHRPHRRVPRTRRPPPPSWPPPTAVGSCWPS